ncbi:MAG: ABC transporter ATP-binding protein [Armatimonadetes bacterium]|nr:ABC transporter ATP-binding protein [Armatimonadota bacterium]
MVRIENLVKQYGKLTAVNDLNLNIETGDIMGFIGPNGAGKTTTIRMVATLLKPTSGKVFVDGIDVVADPEAVRPLIGYMPDFFGLYDDIKVWEYLDFFAAAYKLPKPKRAGSIDDVLELTDLTIKKDSFVSELSRGMQQRLCLAKTLLHDPKLLLLDEPASGLDPRARIEIKELLKELRNMGKTILISSHILPELADFCNKIAIIEQGKLVVSGDVDAIIEQCRGGNVLHITLLDRQEEALALLNGMDTISDTKIEDGTIAATYIGEPGEHYSILEQLSKNGFKVTSFSEAQVDLEDVFMKVTRGAVS